MYNFYMNVELNIKPVNPEEICSTAVYDKDTCSGKSVLKLLFSSFYCLFHTNETLIKYSTM